MICTEKAFDKIMKEIGGNRIKSIFSSAKDKIAYRLSIIKNNRVRGHAVECIVRDLLVSQKNRVWYFGGRHPFDMLVNGSRVEVKSSLAKITTINGKIYYSYQFQNIKTKNFDKLILVFISPNGVHIRQMNCSLAEKYLVNSKTYSGGRTLRVRHHTSKLSGNKLCSKVLTA